MIKKAMLAVMFTMQLAGCASLTPEERLARNKSMSAYSLCENLILSSEPEYIRAEYEKEIASRGTDCNVYAPAIIAARQLRLQNAANLLNYSGQMLAPQQNFQPMRQTQCRQMGGVINCNSW